MQIGVITLTIMAVDHMLVWHRLGAVQAKLAISTQLTAVRYRSNFLYQPLLMRFP